MAYADEMVGISPVTAAALGGQYLALAAAGTSLATSPVVTASMCVVSGADGTKGVTLPQALPGDEQWIFNNSGSTLKVWPGNASTAISVAGTGLGTASNAFSQLTYKACLYKLVTKTQWLVITTA
jgi:hypothetical protein